MPARSKGCRVCVRRRIKCDLTRPKCMRCQVSKLECDGPPSPSLFVDETDPTVARATRSTSFRAKRPKKLSPLGFEGIVSVYVSPSTYSEDVYCVFFVDKIFSFGNWNADLQSNKAWIFDALQNPSKSPVSNLALRCVINGLFGRVVHDENLQNTAQSLYGEALTNLQQHLDDTEHPKDFDVMTAIILLGFFEMSAFTHKNGWMQHIQGLKALVQLKGPGYFRQRPGRSLLMWARFLLHLEALITSQRSFLEDREWQEMMGSDDPIADMSIKLTNISVRIPGLYADSKSLILADDNDRTTQAKELNQRIHKLYDDLQEWWIKFSSDPLRLPVRTTSKPAELDYPLLGSTFLRFPNLDAAAAYCRYHAHVIMILELMTRMSAFLPESTPGTDASSSSPSSSSNPSAREGWTSQRTRKLASKHAYAICEALPYYCLPQYMHLGATYMGFPAKVAYDCFPKDSKEALWMVDIMDTIGVRSGFEVARHTLHNSY